MKNQELPKMYYELILLLYSKFLMLHLLSKCIGPVIQIFMRQWPWFHKIKKPLKNYVENRKTIFFFIKI